MPAGQGREVFILDNPLSETRRFCLGSSGPTAGWRRRMNPVVTHRSPGEDWIAAVGNNGTHDFAAAFAARPVLYASVKNATLSALNRLRHSSALRAGCTTPSPLLGRGGMAPRTYLEWEASFLEKTSQE